MSYRSPDFLSANIRSIINFYYHVSIDHEHGGFINQLLDDGTVFDRETKHLVGTCRFIYNYATAGRLFGDAKLIEAARHGLRFLEHTHRQPDGSYAWVLRLTEVSDATRHSYGHAFVLLAAAAARKAGIEGAAALLDDTWALLERHFFEPAAGLYVDEIAPGDWSAVSPYRGQNANMHMCEAMIAAFEATGESRYLDRADGIASRICLDLAIGAEGLIWEHYRTDWSPDFEYNRDNPKNLFKPYGYLPGHFTEWAKLLLILDRHRPADWRLPRARALFDTASARSWDGINSGMAYSFAPTGEVLDTDRYYWVVAESFAAAALLASRTKEEAYWTWYDRLWAYADAHFVDHRYGGWYRVLDVSGKKYSNEKSPAAKADYHPLGACYEVLVELGAG